MPRTALSLYRAHCPFDLLPQILRRVILRRSKLGDSIMADLTINHRRQARRRRRTKGAQQVVRRVRIQISFLHAGKWGLVKPSLSRKF